MAENYDDWSKEALAQEIEKLTDAIKQERYGLVWLNIPEAFEGKSEEQLPVLKERKDLAIKSKNDKDLNHIVVEGENYYALTCLNYTHKSKVDLIYIDPPYNTGSDGFKYRDKRISDKYPDGTPVPVDHPFRHSYWLSFMRKRMELAYSLMKEDGLLAISIDDNEYAQLKLLLSDHFGNSIKTIVVKMSEASGLKMASIKKSGGVPKYKEYLLLAMKGGVKNLSFDFIPKGEWDREYNLILKNFSQDNYQKYLDLLGSEDPSTELVDQIDQLYKNVEIKSLASEIRDQKISKTELEQWLFDNSWRICRSAASSSVKRLADAKKLKNEQQVFAVSSVRDSIIYLVKGDYDRKSASPRVQLLFAADNLAVHPGDLWTDIKTTGLEAEGGVDFKNGKKPLQLMRRVINAVANKDAVILDFFAGSGTTGEAVMDLNLDDGGNRQFILVTNNDELGNGGSSGTIMDDACYPRLKNSIEGYAAKKGSKDGLKYYELDFVGNNNVIRASDQDAIALAHQAGGMLAMAENTLYEVEKDDFTQFFSNKKAYTAVYFQEDLSEFDKFFDKVSKLDKPTSVYMFSWGNQEFSDEFDTLRHVSVKTIPRPILEIYKRIYNLGSNR